VYIFVNKMSTADQVLGPFRFTFVALPATASHTLHRLFLYNYTSQQLTWHFSCVRFLAAVPAKQLGHAAA